MKCVVTGGSGFIGGHVVEELRFRGYMVISYDSRPPESGSFVEHRSGDVRDFSRMRSVVEDADIVFHLSGLLGTAELMNQPREAIDVNIGGFLNVLESCRETKRSLTVFFPSKPLEWHNIYSMTAQACEKLARTYQVCYGMDVRTTKLLNVFGPRQAIGAVRKAVPDLICRAISGRNVEIYGDGEQLVGLQFVRDVAQFIVDSTVAPQGRKVRREAPQTHIMNVNQLSRAIIDLTDSMSKIEHLPMRTGEQEIRFVTPVKERTNGIKLDPTLLGNLRETIEWYRQCLAIGD